MPLYKPSTRRRYLADTHAYALFEMAYTAVDVAAAVFFITGSILFFSQDWQTAGTWCFLIGSICFALKPTLRILREIRYYESDDLEDLADRFKRQD